MSGDIEVFVKKFPKEFNELVDIFKKFKVENNTDELSKEEAINVVQNDGLKEFLKTLNEDELKELFKLLGIKLKTKVKTKVRKTKISIINSILQKMLLAGLQKEQEKEMLLLLAKMPTNKLEQLDKFDNFEEGLFDKLMNNLLNLNKREVQKVNVVEKNENIIKIKDKFNVFSKQSGETVDLKKIKTVQKQKVNCC